MFARDTKFSNRKEDANNDENTVLIQVGDDVLELSGDLDVRNALRQTSLPPEEIKLRKFSSCPKEYRDFLALEWDKGCYMSDGKRQIDFVLAWEDEDPTTEASSCKKKNSDSFDSDEEEGEDKTTPIDRKARRRAYYEANLEKMGLELERVEISPTLGRTRFTFVHAPFYVLEKQAQLLCVKLPVRKCDVYFQNRKYLPGRIDRWLSKLHIFEFDEETRKKLDEPDFFTAPYSADRRTQFVNWDNTEILFPNAERVRMVHDLLTRAHYGDPHRDYKNRVHFRFGIDRLLANYTYTAAFPLHQELRDRTEIQLQDGPASQRELLYLHWASWRNLIKYQPLDSVKRYFGTKIALYFAWLGYYTRSLYLASLVGVLCVIFGMWNVKEDIVSNDICGKDGIGARVVICPACEDLCDFQRLNSSCAYAKMSYLFDNGMTVIFAALMSVWATIFLEGWKRYHSEIAWKWGLMDFVVEEELVRPDFQFRVKTRRYNPVTQQDEPFLSGKKKAANWIASTATVLFFIILVLASVFGMIVYRVIMMKLLAQANDPKVDSWAFLIVTITAAIINLIVIIIMNYIYYEIALCLTRWECPRTQTDFDNSFTFKVFLFQFVNYYSSLFYVAFFKGVLSQIPGAKDHVGNVKIIGYRLEGCDPAGCFVELVVQLATIFCGRQFINAAIELAYPVIMTLLRKWQWRVPILETKTQKRIRIHNESQLRAGKMSRWEADYYLSPSYDQFLFDEYLEMVLQFGFVTLFVSAFPLAPLFALINNILEIRLDAYKFLVTQQRPVPEQAKNIGVWINILDFLSKASVTINALVIAFTSDFVPKTLYYYANGSLVGYVDSSLSWFDASSLHIKPGSEFKDTSICRYRGYREPPCALNATIPRTQGHPFTCDDAMTLSYEWWRVLATRLIFVVVFEHIVFLLKIFVEYLIEDVPERIFVQQQREKYLLRKALLADLAAGGSDTSRAAADGDSEETAFQPGAFTHDMIEGYKPLNHMNNGNKRAPLARTSTSLESFETAQTTQPSGGEEGKSQSSSKKITDV